MVTKKEVELRLKRFQDPLRKADYIKKLLSRTPFLGEGKKGKRFAIPSKFSKETEQALYSNLGDAYYKKFKKTGFDDRNYNYLADAAESYAHAGETEKARNLLHKKFHYSKSPSKDHYSYVPGAQWIGYLLYGGENLSEKDEKKAEKIEARIGRIETGLRKKARKSLETKTTTLTIVSLIIFILGLFFLSSNFTGYTIANLTQNNSNIIGGVLFVLGIIGVFFYFKKKE